MPFYEKAVAGIKAWKPTRKSRKFGPIALMEIVNKDNPEPLGLFAIYRLYKDLENNGEIPEGM